MAFLLLAFVLDYHFLCVVWIEFATARAASPHGAGTVLFGLDLLLPAASRGARTSACLAVRAGRALAGWRHRHPLFLLFTFPPFGAAACCAHACACAAAARCERGALPLAPDAARFAGFFATCGEQRTPPAGCRRATFFQRHSASLNCLSFCCHFLLPICWRELPILCSVCSSRWRWICAAGRMVARSCCFLCLHSRKRRHTGLRCRQDSILPVAR